MADVVLVGAGNMGFAMLRRWVDKPGNRIVVLEPAQPLRERAEQIGVVAYADASDLPADLRADVVVIATKPDVVGGMVELLAPLLGAEGLLISVAAGIDIATMAKRAGRELAIIRCMPNTPAAIGEGMIVCCPSATAGPAHRARAEDLLSAVGQIAFIDDEALMDAVTAVSGSGPAYVFHFIEALAEAGQAAGLDGALALRLALQTVYGAAKLAIESAEQPDVLRKQVTSPNGTTAAALGVLMRDGDGLGALLNEAVDAARLRSIALRAPNRKICAFGLLYKIYRYRIHMDTGPRSSESADGSASGVQANSGKQT